MAGAETASIGGNLAHIVANLDLFPKVPERALFAGAARRAGPGNVRLPDMGCGNRQMRGVFLEFGRNFNVDHVTPRSAQAKAKELQRGEGSVSVTAIGDAGIDAGLPLLFANVRPGVDGVPYIIKTAKTAYTKTGGLEVAVSGRLYDGKSATEKSAGTESGGSSAAPDASKATGKVAPNSAPGTPATPSSFLTPRRFGRTDEN